MHMTTRNETLSAYLPIVVTGKNIILTGGTTGIGRAAALLLASLGNHVLICGRHEEELQDTLNDFHENESGGSLSGLIADLSSAEDIQKLFRQADEQFERLDIFINNAALAFQSIQDGEYSDWEYLLKTNLLAYMACSREAIDRMKKYRLGHIVNIGSMSADVREEGSSVYVATKAAIQGFSEALRKEVNRAEGIKVTLIEPGATGTDLQPFSPEHQRRQEDDGEMLKAEDVAGAILYALSQPRRCDVVAIQIRPHLQLI
jgi:NADP-dependent 3-hydroxy acid dehydrogenase YdfG